MQHRKLDRFILTPVLFLILLVVGGVSAETRTQSAESHISDFISIVPTGQTTRLQLPATHVFQYLSEEGDALTEGGSFMGNYDFTGFVPINGSSTQGRVGLNHERNPGGVSIMDVTLDSATQQWNVTASRAVDFSNVAGTARNCSGAVTPWNTFISCEETVSGDGNDDGYNDLGWCIEIDPVSGSVVDQTGDLDGADKLWAMGNFAHENLVVHDNWRTVYLGTDNRTGYLYKFVADVAQNLSAGTLYAFKDLGDGNGEWVQLANTTPAERNSVAAQAGALGARVFDGIEDVEISPLDGMVYFAVKGEGRVYRLNDADPLAGTTVTGLETYVGNMSYMIDHAGGSTSVAWGNGNDNLAFDNLGNLWVLQDGGNNYIWVVGVGHTQNAPKVSLFGTVPLGAEPTGITFTPDNNYLFMSIQHPFITNGVTAQPDAFGEPRTFSKDVAIVIARAEMLGAPTALTLRNQPQSQLTSPLLIIAGLAATLLLTIRYCARTEWWQSKVAAKNRS